LPKEPLQRAPTVTSVAAACDPQLVVLAVPAVPFKYAVLDVLDSKTPAKWLYTFEVKVEGPLAWPCPALPTANSCKLLLETWTWFRLVPALTPTVVTAAVMLPHLAHAQMVMGDPLAGEEAVDSRWLLAATNA
jgi:hypothetical protein